MSAPFAPGSIRPGCTVRLRVAQDGQEGTIEWLITRGRTRVDEGVLGHRTRLARTLMGRRVGEVVAHRQSGQAFWIRIEAIECPVGSTFRDLDQEPATLHGLGGLTVRIAYEEGWLGPLPQGNPEDDASRQPGENGGAGGYWDDGDL